jgi:uncharacterized alkaline shock family protein YloU
MTALVMPKFLTPERSNGWQRRTQPVQPAPLERLPIGGIMDDVEGKVTVAPNVLTAIVKQTAVEQRGVHHLAPLPQKMRGLLAGAASEEGIFIAITEEGVRVELHVVAESATNMLKLGSALQNSIVRAMEEMVGMRVAAVDVYIDDVALAPESTDAAETR